MPRQKGSKNKIKNTGNSMVITKLDKHIEGSPITKVTPNSWVNWGVKNNYPNMLLDLYNQSTTHKACINFAVQSILGNGVDFEAMKLAGDEVVPNMNQTWDDIIRSLALDYALYGSYAIEAIMNKDGKTFSFFHIPLEKVRWGEYDPENGNINSFFICSDWTAWSTYGVTEVEAMNHDTKFEKGKPYLFVYRTYSPAMTYYTSPLYSAGIKAVQSEIEFINYDLRSSVNGFVPAGMLRLNAVESDEERQAIIANITSMFTGTNNANSLMISFRSNPDEEDPSFIPFTANATNVNLYDASNERTVKRILAAHQIPNASLIGLPDIGSTGFASEADKLETAYQLYNKLTGNNNRMAIVRTLNQMFKLNGIETEIVMKPLSFKDFDNDADVKERTDSVDVDDNEVPDEENNVGNEKEEA